MTSAQLLAQSQKLKEEGNKLFSKRSYKEASEMYSKALEKCPSVAAYLTNRALCSLKLQQWQAVVDDCRRALDLDPHSVKALFYMGQAMCEQAHFDEALVYLKRAADLAKELNENYGDEITKCVRLAKRKRWNYLEEKRIRQEIELQSYLSQLMAQDKERLINNVKMNTSPPMSNIDEKNVTKTGVEEKKVAVAEEKEKEKEKSSLNEKQQQQIMEIESEFEKRFEELNRLFAENDQRRRKREIPDYLCGKISFELMVDPVITPSGITYDRYDIEQHLQRVGRFDPVTRQELSIDQLIPNLSMKEVIENFITENEWIDGAY